MIPGITAPTKRLPTGTLSMLPRRTSTILGGMICPSVPDAIIIPVAALVS